MDEIFKYLDENPDEFQDIMAGVNHFGEEVVKSLLQQASEKNKKLVFYHSGEGLDDLNYRFEKIE